MARARARLHLTHDGLPQRQYANHRRCPEQISFSCADEQSVSIYSGSGSSCESSLCSTISTNTYPSTVTSSISSQPAVSHQKSSTTSSDSLWANSACVIWPAISPSTSSILPAPSHPSTYTDSTIPSGHSTASTGFRWGH